ncbi:MAG: hypothetical protein WBL95_27105 [Microcoleus sp.]
MWKNFAIQPREKNHQGPMPYSLCPMPYSLCPIPYSLCPIPYSLLLTQTSRTFEN